MPTQLKLFKLGRKFLSPRLRAEKKLGRRVEGLLKSEAKKQKGKLEKYKYDYANAMMRYRRKRAAYETSLAEYRRGYDVWKKEAQATRAKRIEYEQALSRAGKRLLPKEAKEYHSKLKKYHRIKKEIESTGWKVKTGFEKPPLESDVHTYVDITSHAPKNPFTSISTRVRARKKFSIPDPPKHPIFPTRPVSEQVEKLVAKKKVTARERIQATRLARKAYKSGVINKGLRKKLQSRDISKLTTAIKTEVLPNVNVGIIRGGLGPQTTSVKRFKAEQSDWGRGKILSEIKKRGTYKTHSRYGDYTSPYIRKRILTGPIHERGVKRRKRTFPKLQQRKEE